MTELEKKVFREVFVGKAVRFDNKEQLDNIKRFYKEFNVGYLDFEYNINQRIIKINDNLNAYYLGDIIGDRKYNFDLLLQYYKGTLRRTIMKQLNNKIITWLKHHNIDKLEPDKQYLKIIEEVGELARGLLKSDLEAIKDAIGDIYVALMGYKLQKEIIIDFDKTLLTEDTTMLISLILYYIGEDLELNDDTIVTIIKAIEKIAINNNLTLKECVSHAYNEIKDREIKIKNGVAVKND